MSLEVDYVGATGNHQTAARHQPAAGAAPGACRRGGRIRGSATSPCRRRRSRATTRRCSSSCSSGRLCGLWYLVSYTYSGSRRAGCRRRRSAATTPQTQAQPWDIPHLFSASYGLRAAVWQRAQVPRSNAGGGDQRHRRGLAVPEHHQLPQRAAGPRRPSHGTSRISVLADSGPNQVGSGELENPTHRPVVRQDRVRRPRQFHIW